MPETRNHCLQVACNSQCLKDKKSRSDQQTSSRAKMKHDIWVIYPWDLEMDNAKKIVANKYFVHDLTSVMET